MLMTAPVETREAKRDESLAVFDRKAALHFICDDEHLLDELLESFLAQAPEYLGDARRAIEDRSTERLGRAAHTLIGSASIFCAKSVCRVAAELERQAQTADWTRSLQLCGQLEEELRWLRTAWERSCVPS